MDLGQLVQSYGYPVVAFGTFLEGEAVLIAAGFAAHRGYLNLLTVMAIAAFASFCGDQLYYLFGRRFGSQLLARFPSLQSSTDRMQALIGKHQMLIILAIRFLYGLRVAGPIAIGMNRSVRWRTFVVLNAIGALVWAVLIAGAGYLFGQTIEIVLADLRDHESDYPKSGGGLPNPAPHAGSGEPIEHCTWVAD